MLPPVPAASVALQANQRQASSARTEAGMPAADDTILPTAMARPPTGPTSSHELLDLSGQLRLGQSLSVFAETLGSLLKLPRREGEALADYSKRLAAAINLLSSADRAKLQTQLNQIMQGATLRLLAELLKDPSGPAAARLAVQIEIAQYKERDLAAGHVVSSYRQNNGTEADHLAANANLPDGVRPQAQKPANLGEAARALPVAAQDNAGSHLPSGIARQNAALAEALIDLDGMANGTASFETAAPSAAEALISSGETQAADPGFRLEAQDATEPRITTATGPHATPGENPDMEARTDPEPQLASGKNVATAPADHQKPVSMQGERAPPKAGTIYDAAALIRRAHDQGHLSELRSPEAIVEHLVTEWVADPEMGKQQARDVRHGSVALPPPPAAMMDMKSAKIALEDGDQAELKRHTTQATDHGMAPLQASALPTATTMQTATSIAQQTDGAFEKALLGMMQPPREPPAHPLVPHQGAQEFDDEGDHQIKRKPAVGDDGQPSRQGFGDGHFSRDQQQPQQQETPPETVLSQIEGDAFSEMEAVATASDPKEAPRQHLSNHPQQGAEDFYRRLAILE